MAVVPATYEALKAVVDRDEDDFACELVDGSPFSGGGRKHQNEEERTRNTTNRTWCQLLAAVEAGTAAHPERVEPTFEAFLKRFPLCFGYWCKYAEAQAKLKEAGVIDEEGAKTKVSAIYERALEAVPTSVELWKVYCAYVKKLMAGEVSDTLRAAYKRATLAVGTDPTAAGLWDSYLEFEADRGTPQEVCGVFRAMLESDCSGRTDDLWKRFKVLAKTYHIKELCGEDDRAGLLERYRKRNKMNLAEDEEEQMAAGRTAGMSELQEQRQCDQLMTEAEAAKNDLIQRRLERAQFEAGIRRSYFHVKPLDEAQLQNWRDYLTAEDALGTVAEAAPGMHLLLVPPANTTDATEGGEEENNGEENENEKKMKKKKTPAATTTTDVVDVLAVAKLERTRRLYERCLVPCALYSEFWVRYVDWTRGTLGDEAALRVAERSLNFVPKRIDVVYKHALLLEAVGRLVEAREAFAAIAAYGNGLKEEEEEEEEGQGTTTSENTIALRRASCALICANFERRRCDSAAAIAAYDTAARPPIVTAHKARFLHKHLGRLADARRTLDDALAHQPESATLWIARANLERSRLGADKPNVVFDAIADVYDRALFDPQNNIPTIDLQNLWAQYVALSYDSGHDAKHLLNLRAKYAAWLQTLSAANANAALSETQRDGKSPMMQHQKTSNPPEAAAATRKRKAVEDHASSEGASIKK